MKTLITWLLTLCVLLTCAGSAEGASQEQLIFAPSDDNASPGLQISGKDQDGNDVTRNIIGVVSEPVPRAYSLFFESYQGILSTVFNAESWLSNYAYSNGAWARAESFGRCCVVVYTSGESALDEVIHISVTGDAQSANMVLALAAACMMSAGNVGQMGTAAMYALMMDSAPARYFENPVDVWLENGYQLSFGTDDMGVLYGNITYTQDLPVKSGYLPLDPDALISLSNNLSLKQFGERLAAFCPTFGLTAPEIPDTYDVESDARVYRFYWDDCAVVLSASDAPYIAHIALASVSENTSSLWLRAMLMYNAVTDAPITDFEWIALLAGSGGGWQRLTELSPYAVYRDAMLSCVTSGDMPCALITGAISK